VLTRTLVAQAGQPPLQAALPPPDHEGRVWIDVIAASDDVAALIEITDRFDLDRLAVRDAVVDVDLPKVDDFGDHLLAVFHGLRDDQVGTYEVHCLMSERALVTIHDRPSPALDALWEQAQRRPELSELRTDQMLAMTADVLTRRLMGVIEAFDDRVEELIARALGADGTVLEDLSAVRADNVGVRRAVHPQREALDQLRHSPSRLITEQGRRRFSDVFDVASRAAAGLDDARSALAETLDAYRGAEARQATEVTKVLTVYAAIMLPLSLIAGFFGMNFTNLPWTERRWGWLLATGLMVLVAVVSLGMFVSLGWVRRPSGRRAGQALGRGLIEATKAPVHIVGAVLEVTTLPIRATGELLSRPLGESHDDDEDRTTHGAE
jgi:magnesium transporter